jgi:hypothetical protein
MVCQCEGDPKSRSCSWDHPGDKYGNGRWDEVELCTQSCGVIMADQCSYEKYYFL